MGLLKRRPKQPIQQLQSRNPTGLPTQSVTESKNISDPSVIAAQAAAAQTLNKTSQVVSLSTASTKSYPKPSQPRTIVQPRPKITIKSESRNLDSKIPYGSPSSRTGSPIQSVKPHEPLQSPLSSQHEPTDPRSLSTQRVLGDNDFVNSLSNLSIQAANVASRESFQTSHEFYKPHTSLPASGFYSSSPSSTISSTNFFEPLPQFIKSQYDGGFESPRFDRSQESLNKSMDSFGPMIHSVTEPKETSLNEKDSLPSYRELKYPIFEREEQFDDECSETESQYADMSSQTLPPTLPRNATFAKSQDHIHNPREAKPFNIKSSSSSSLINPPGAELSLARRSSQSFPTRKPPPKSPSLVPSSPVFSPGYSALVPSPPKPGIQRRASSPRRKPPPDTIIDNLTDSERYSSAFEDTEDEIPRYPPVTRDQYNSYKRRHHGLRSNAKKLLRKGLKTRGSVNSKKHQEPQPSDKPVQLRSTLRKEKKKETFNEDKPWKHHLDREYISENERKRYEGVWVSNRGLYMNLADSDINSSKEEYANENTNTALTASRLSTRNTAMRGDPELMLNLVVREIWSRSKLPPDTLRQVWDLVDARKDGTLDKASFVVGMWLVDQCLYGRKLPKAVDAAVWNSVSHIGVNVVIKPKKKK